MIRIYWPAGRKYAGALIDVVNRRVASFGGATLSLPPVALPAIELHAHGVAELVWPQSPVVQHSGTDIPVGPAIRVHETEKTAALFLALRHETVPVRPGLGLVFHGGIVPVTELMPDGVRLRWRDRVRADVTGLPAMIEPNVDHIDVYRTHAVVVLNGFNDVRLEFSDAAV